MSSEHGPLMLVRFASAVVRHQIKKQAGEEALEVIAGSAAGQAEALATSRVAQFFGDRRQAEAVMRAAQDADECFRVNCGDDTLRQLAQMPVGELPKVQSAIGSLPETVNRADLTEVVRGVLREDYGGQLTDGQIGEASDLYVRCLEEQLLKVAGIREIITGLSILNTERIVEKTSDDVGEVKAGVGGLQASFDLMLAQQREGAPRSMLELAKKAEADNPGASIRIESTPQGTNVVISPQPDAGVLNLGTLGFTDDEASRLARQRFRKALDEGRPVTLEPGEAKWEPGLRLPPPLSLEGRKMRLNIAPRTTDEQRPVRLESRPFGGSAQTIGYAVARQTRRGLRELEFIIGEGRFAGSIVFVVRDDGTHSVHLNLVLNSQAPSRVLETIAFVQSIQRGAELNIFDLREDDVWIYGECKIDEPLDLTVPKLLIEWLDVINRTYGLDLRFSESIDEETWETIEIVAEGLRRRVVKYAEKGEKEIGVEKQTAVDLLGVLTDEANLPENLAFSFENAKFNVLGNEITLPYVSILTIPRLAEEAAGVYERLEALTDKSQAFIRISYDEALLSFNKPEIRPFSQTSTTDARENSD